MNQKENQLSKIYWLVITIVVSLGIYIRFKGLGTWPLALDEYYLVKSSENILKYGLPQFPNGGYYFRGVLLQYLIAPLLSIGISAEFAGRFFSLISNLLALPAIFLIAKKVSNNLLATTVVIIFSLSIWEIEFARFARMYAPFQAIFMWYIYFALLDIKNHNFKNYKWMLLLSIISIFVYEGSIFLAVFNFVPFILNRKIKLNFLSGAFVVFIVSVFVNEFDFRSFNIAPIFPPELSETIKNSISQPPIKIPKVLLLYAFDNVLSLIFTIIIISLTTFLVVKIIKLLPNKNFWSVLSIVALAVFALLNQFGFFIFTLLIFSFWNLLDISLSDKKVILLIFSIFIINFIYWFGFGLLSNNWYELFNDFSSYSTWGITKRLLIGFFNYPDNFYSLVNYTKTLPLLTIFAVLSLVSLVPFLLKSKNEPKSEIKFLFGTVIFLSLLATIPTLLYRETRYTFFLVPLLVILVSYSIYFVLNKFLKNELYRNITFIAIIFAVFIFSRDFNLYHLLNIDSQEVNYRMIYKSNLIKRHLYRRWDIKTPTDYVKQNLHDGDIIMINENSHEQYLPRVDYFSFDYRHKAFVSFSVERGTKERWSNAKLIYTNKDLINFIENRKSTIWFITYPENYLFEMNFYKKYRKYMVYEGVDKMIKVFKFPMNKNLK